MRKIINGLVNMANHKAAPDVAKGVAGAGIGFLAAPTAARVWSGEEISPGAQAAVTALGGAVGGGLMGRRAGRLGARLAPSLAMTSAADRLISGRQGFSMLNTEAVKTNAKEMLSGELERNVNKYLPQTALPDGTARRTLSPEARAAIDKLVGRGFKPQQLLDSLGFQYSSLHGLTGTDAADRAAAYLKGRSRYHVPTLG